MSEKQTIDHDTRTDEEGTRSSTYVSTTKIKSGLKTTEFWISLAAAVASFVIAQGFITEDQVANVVSVAGPIVAAFGYSLSRGLAKK